MQLMRARYIPWPVPRWLARLADSWPRPRETADSRSGAAAALQQHGDAILRLAYSYLHNLSDAEDVLQDTLLQLLRKQPAFETAEHRKAWLLRVAINLSKNKLKARKNHGEEELPDQLAQAADEDLSFVWEAVRSLPEAYREVVHLYYQESYATKEIAALLHKKDATVRSLLARGRAMLKETLKEAYDFEESL